MDFKVQRTPTFEFSTLVSWEVYFIFHLFWGVKVVEYGSSLHNVASVTEVWSPSLGTSICPSTHCLICWSLHNAERAIPFPSIFSAQTHLSTKCPFVAGSLQAAFLRLLLVSASRRHWQGTNRWEEERGWGFRLTAVVISNYSTGSVFPADLRRHFFCGSNDDVPIHSNSPGLKTSFNTMPLVASGPHPLSFLQIQPLPHPALTAFQHPLNQFPELNSLHLKCLQWFLFSWLNIPKYNMANQKLKWHNFFPPIIYGRFHYQLKETIMITLLSKPTPWNNFGGVTHKSSTILDVGKQNALDGGPGQIIFQEKLKRLEEKHWYRGKNTTLKNKFLGSKSDFFID